MKTREGRNLRLCAAALLMALVTASAPAQNTTPVPPPLPASVPRPPVVAPRPQAVQPSNLSPAPAPSVPVAAIPTRAEVSPSVVPVPTPIPVVQPAPITPPPPATDPNAIKWDAEAKEIQASPGQTTANFTFWLTNVSSADVFVNSVRTSCGCTVAKLPAQPWRIGGGSNGPIEVTMNLAGKSGMIAKGVTVDTSSGIKQLTVKTMIPGAAPGQVSGTMNDTERLKNMQLALADRQVVFKNQECAKCHSDPAKGQTDGRLLYAGVCATCHNSAHRAAMVPDLRTLPHPTDAEHWRKWITYGRAGSMMPAFAESEGGPLNEQQINALVDFMAKTFPNRPQRAALPAPGSTVQVAPAASYAPATGPAPKAN
jgi:mono/diheme cytochrome c family protein